MNAVTNMSMIVNEDLTAPSLRWVLIHFHLNGRALTSILDRAFLFNKCENPVLLLATIPHLTAGRCILLHCYIREQAYSILWSYR